MLQHKHLLLRAKIKHAPNEYEILTTEKWLKEFVKANNMQLEIEPRASYVFDKGNKGMTCCCLIKTSHIAFHIWDEKNPPLLQFDFYTCGDLNVYKTMKLIDEKFGLLSYDSLLLNREKSLDILSMDISK